MTTTRNRIRRARTQAGEQLALIAADAEVVDEDWRLANIGSFDEVPARVLDVRESIPALGYGSHQYFRYYGKFPSVVGREIVSRFATSSCPVLDCYNGSGTTLVEAQIAGHSSAGIDINPLSVLASNVKSAYYDAASLRDGLDTLLSGLHDDPGWRPTKIQTWLDKWFPEAVQSELSAMRARLEELQDHPAYEFLSLAYLAIIRRVSRAHDGEVRPHINRDKRVRNALEAFELKTLDNIAGLRDLDTRRPKGIPSRAVVGDNRNPATYSEVLDGEQAGLVVAHPPYLNSFNYLGAFSLELAWSEGLRAVWSDGMTEAGVRALEQRAWPATDPKIVEGYYAALEETVKAACASARPGAVLALVVGDATIRRELEPVHIKVWDAVKDQGLEPMEVWFRTTHYGIGKYAYATRADYHGDAEKRDAILFMRVP